MSGWQPIETAPKDGTMIDVWVVAADVALRSRITDVSWREPTDSEWWVHGGDTIETPDATWHDCFGPLSECEQPTHWMPLPQPPAAQSSADLTSSSRGSPSPVPPVPGQGQPGEG